MFDAEYGLFEKLCTELHLKHRYFFYSKLIRVFRFFEKLTDSKTTVKFLARIPTNTRIESAVKLNELFQTYFGFFR